MSPRIDPVLLEGQCVLQRVYDYKGAPLSRIIVERADPVARVSLDFVQELRRQSYRSGLGDPDAAQEAVLDGWVLTINASNRRVVYVIDPDSFDGSSYRMRWPD